MNIVVLIKPYESDNYIWNYADKIRKITNSKLHVLNVVAVNGEIPVKKNGRVLDICTEFDLSPYHNTSGENRREIKKILPESGEVELHAFVGNPSQMISSFVKENDIDLIITGAKITSELEDIFTSNFAENLLDNVDIPILTLKCERDANQIKKIGHIGDFAEPGKRKMELVKVLQEVLGAELTLYRINTPHNLVETLEVERNMQEFVKQNDLNDVEFKVVAANNTTTGVQDLVMSENLDFVILGHMKRGKKLSFLNGDLKADILNKTLAPIYIY